jgi:glycolate oxidase FAD binding subunit
MLAAGVAGPLRLRFGAPRDLLIGITVVRADGTIAKAGGKVVKNVAGYDLGKLFAGSAGTLGLIAEAIFRLHPRPTASAWVSARYSGAGDAAQALVAAGGCVLAPAAAELHWPGLGQPLTVAVLLEGHPEGVAERAARMADLLTSAGPAPDRTGQASPSPDITSTGPSWWGNDSAAPDGTVLRVAFWPGKAAAVLDAIREAAVLAGVDPATGGPAAAGVLHLTLPGEVPAGAAARFVAALRQALRAGEDGPSRASAVVLDAPPAVRDAVDLWGPVPAVALMRAVKDQFDPGHRMAPGRLAGGI